MTMPWGKYKGRHVCNLPDDYLRWLQVSKGARGYLRTAIEVECRRRFGEVETVKFDNLADSERELLAEIVRSGYRALSRKHHPDVGGNPEIMRRLNLLMEKLRDVLQRQEAKERSA